MGLFRRASVTPTELPPTSIDPLVAAFHRAISSRTLDPSLAGLFGGAGSSSWLADRVGVANRCLQLVAQNVASLKLRYRRREGLDQAAPGPAWLSNPDPAWYPNGIRDAVFAITWSMLRDGDAFVYVTSRYADGYPATWTVLNAEAVEVEERDGTRRFTAGGAELESSDVVQISRDPRGALRGSSALQAYSANLSAAYTAEAFASTVFSGGGIPSAILQSTRRLTTDQAFDVQTQWVTRGQANPGAPRVIPPELTFIAQAFSPRDMALIESRQYDAEQIAAAFGVPAPLLNLPLPASGLTYTNTASLAEFWWRFELLPGPVEAITQALGRLVPAGNWVEADASRYLRPDLPTMVESVTKLLDAGIVTAVEARALLDLPPAEAPIRDFEEPAASGAGVTTLRPVPVLEEVERQ